MEILVQILHSVKLASGAGIRLDEKHEWVEIFQKHAWESGRTFSGFETVIDWPRQEVLLMLKARKRSISIQSWYSFVEMEKPANFRYKVLLGDAIQVGRELAKSSTRASDGIA